MNLTDIIALAKAGYKASEIKELLTMPTEPPAEPPKEEPPAEPPKEEPPKEEPPAEPPKEEPDYKALYEKSQQDLKKAQENNLRQDGGQPQKKTDADIVTEAIRMMFD